MAGTGAVPWVFVSFLFLSLSFPLVEFSQVLLQYALNLMVPGFVSPQPSC